MEIVLDPSNFGSGLLEVTKFMSKSAYCYTCGIHHPIEDMRQVATGKGVRWRCIKTIEASRQARAKRQEFGAQTTANNKGGSKSSVQKMVRPEQDSQ